MKQLEVSAVEPRRLGRRLQEARKARGLTQQDVAEALTVARTTVTAMEKGERRVRPDDIIRMAALYGRSVNDLMGARDPIEDFAVQFRTAVRSAGSPEAERDLERAVNDFQILCEDYLYLEGLCGTRLRQSYIPRYPISGTVIEAAAEEIAWTEHNRLGLGDGPIHNLRDLLENEAAIRVFHIDLPSRVAGMFSFSDDLGGCIAVNARHPQERRRWTMAHEYGHFLTSRYSSEISVLGTRGRMPADERFADAFARCFLMPATGLRRRFNQIRSAEARVTAADICRMAHYYFVSVEAMTLRLEELRLLPSGTWDRLKDRGFRIREAQAHLGLEPRSDDEYRLPTRYRLLAVQAYEDELITEGELLRLLRTDRATARRTVLDHTHMLHLEEEGEVASLPIDLTGSLSV